MSDADPNMNDIVAGLRSSLQEIMFGALVGVEESIPIVDDESCNFFYKDPRDCISDVLYLAMIELKSSCAQVQQRSGRVWIERAAYPPWR